MNSKKYILFHRSRNLEQTYSNTQEPKEIVKKEQGQNPPHSAQNPGFKKVKKPQQQLN